MHGRGAGRWLRGVMVACVAGLGLLPVAQAADQSKPGPDSALLEFLGSGDDQDPALQDYLARREARQAAHDAGRVHSTAGRGDEAEVTDKERSERT